MADDIARWLEGLGLGQYARTFAEHDIDLDVLPRLFEGNPKELSLTLVSAMITTASVVTRIEVTPDWDNQIMRMPALMLLAAILSPLTAAADEFFMPLVTDKLVRKECGECHLTFHPVLLPAASWRKIMETLADHFGEDASMDAEPYEKVKAYLIANSARGRSNPENPPLRFTDLNYFQEGHREGDVESMIRDRNVKTWADCSACHRNAKHGYFD